MSRFKGTGIWPRKRTREGQVTIVVEEEEKGG
jgi:hypothetical protein